MSNITVQLKQTKAYVGPLRFAVRHQALNAAPAPLVAPFVVDQSSNLYDKERLVRVATLDDFIQGQLQVRPLTCLFDAAGAITAQAGDTLVIQNPPPEWVIAPAGVVTYKVTGGTSERGGVVVDEPFWWSVAGDLSWQLWRNNLLVQAGTGGWTERLGGDGPCLTDRFQAMFADGETALNNLVAVQGWVNALAQSAGLDGGQFEQFPPGNPVVNTFSR